MQTIVITGASDGIGAEMARQLAAAQGTGVTLVLAARNETALNEVAAQCRQHGAKALVVPTDVSVEAQCRTLIETA
ncbi:SDR family NAD(P)-dependent oxidoreductase, partial [Leptospira sp. SA-E8]|uniref:SDR family NAD(P)-dependent oxidoreductase n=1 Tax=Leptospira sp. SA-E8 TaxID=3422259 RepID=UPI003EBE0CCA